MASVSCRDSREPQCFSERDDRRVNEPELEIVKPAIQVGDSRVAVAREISDEIVPINDAAVKGQLAPRAETAPQQVIDLRDDRRRQNQTISFALDQRPCLRVPPIAAVVIRVDNAGVEKDAHRRFFVRELVF